MISPIKVNLLNGIPLPNKLKGIDLKRSVKTLKKKKNGRIGMMKLLEKTCGTSWNRCKPMEKKVSGKNVIKERQVISHRTQEARSHLQKKTIITEFSRYRGNAYEWLKADAFWDNNTSGPLTSTNIIKAGQGALGLP